MSDMQLVQDAERRRALIKDIIFPYLMEMDDTIGYTKLFLQAYSGLIEGIYETRRKIITIGDLSVEINKKLDNLFPNDETKMEKKRYVELTKLLEEISVQDLSYASELPRYMEGFLVQESSKRPLKSIDIMKILG